MRTLFILILLITFPHFSFSSSSKGDQDPIFQTCLRSCISTCHISPYKPDIFLTLFKWTCTDNCKYECMHKTIAISPTPIHQYYGKWPFTRFLGMQEPFSVLFSILNFVAHYHGYIAVSKLPNEFIHKPYLILFPFTGMNMWIWSALFHSRDTPLTEKLDYFSAFIYLLVGLYYAILRIFYPSNKYKWMVFIVFCVFYGLHVSYLSFYKFDYVYNMVSGITIGVLSMLFWMYWYIRNKEYKHSIGIVVTYGLLVFAIGFEIFDFPPVFGIDAHSCWHFLTVPVTYLYYTFYLADAKYSKQKQEYIKS